MPGEYIEYANGAAALLRTWYKFVSKWVSKFHDRQLYTDTESKPGTERVQALADISRSALCCHSNKARAPITDCKHAKQCTTMEGTPYHSPKLTSGSVQ